MPKFRVTVRQDAWIYHEATIEAPNAETAAGDALHAWRFGAEDVKFTETGHDGFDHADCEAEDCELMEDEDATVHHDT